MASRAGGRGMNQRKFTSLSFRWIYLGREGLWHLVKQIPTGFRKLENFTWLKSFTLLFKKIEILMDMGKRGSQFLKNRKPSVLPCRGQLKRHLLSVACPRLPRIYCTCHPTWTWVSGLFSDSFLKTNSFDTLWGKQLLDNHWELLDEKLRSVSGVLWEQICSTSSFGEKSKIPSQRLPGLIY